MQLQNESQLSQPISRIVFQGCSKELQAEVRSRLPILEGELLSEELLQRVREAAQAVNAHLEIRVDRAMTRAAFLEILPKIPEKFRDKMTPPACDEGVSVTIYDPAALPQRIRIESSALESMLVEKVMPADSARTGEVRLTVVVGKDGTVMEVSPLAGPEWLMESAMGAVRRWRYRPMLLNGFPVEVQTSVEV